MKIKEYDTNELLMIANNVTGEYSEKKVRQAKEELTHDARRVEIFDEKKKPVVLLTNNFGFSIEDVSDIYRLGLLRVCTNS